MGYLHRGIEKLAESPQVPPGRHAARPRRLHRRACTPRPRSRWPPRSSPASRCRDKADVDPLADDGAQPHREPPRVARHVRHGRRARWRRSSTSMRDREAILDILEAITGGRMMFNYVRPGGVFADLPAGIDEKIRAFLDTFDTYLDEYGRPARRQRDLPGCACKNVGVISTRRRRWRSASPAASLRASGVDFDVRKAMPYCAYPRARLRRAARHGGDCWDRYVVRIEEMRQAARMIRQLVDGMPEGDHTAKVPKVLRPPAGESVRRRRVAARRARHPPHLRRRPDPVPHAPALAGLLQPRDRRRGARRRADRRRRRHHRLASTSCSGRSTDERRRAGRHPHPRACSGCCSSTASCSSTCCARCSAACTSASGRTASGPFGLLQTVADVVKLLTKEDLMPDSADKWLFWIAPFVVFVPSFMAYLPLAFGPNLAVTRPRHRAAVPARGALARSRSASSWPAGRRTRSGRSSAACARPASRSPTRCRCCSRCSARS